MILMRKILPKDCLRPFTGQAVLCRGQYQAHNAKQTFIEDIRPVIEMKPDALIMSDAGMIMMVREAFQSR